MFLDYSFSKTTAIPTEDIKITFGEIINLSEKYLNSSLNIIGLEEGIKLQVHILEYNEAENKEYDLEVDLETTFEWEKNQLLVFSAKGISGVITTEYDLIFDPETDQEDPWWKLNTYRAKTIHNLNDKFEKTNKSWFLHRSDEKHKIINISCAIISVALAELTSGLISSTDQTWGYGQYFVEKDTFLKFHLEPNENPKENSMESKSPTVKTGFWHKLKKRFN
jgi:hypothetical protein